MKRNLLISLLIAPFFASIFVAGKLYYNIKVWQYDGETQLFVVQNGESFASLNYRLYKNKMISSLKTFHRYSQYHNFLNKVRAGGFEIPHGATMSDILYILKDGKIIAEKIVVPEGKNIYEIGKILEAHDVVTYKEFVDAAKDPEILNKFNIDSESMEGHLFPDTYYMQKKQSAESVIKVMNDLWKKKLEGIDLSKNPLGLTPEQVIILASIVEKETGYAVERPIIAGVFTNRLKDGMRLQSDPTTIYGMYEEYDGKIQKSDLQKNTPYNTYTIKALPIGPICNPSLEAIKAVLNPATHNYLFFVSQNDGTHVFTATYGEHQKAVNYFQKTKENREGKSWRDLKKNKL